MAKKKSGNSVDDSDTEQLNIKLDAQLKREVKALAALRGQSLQDFVVACINQYVANTLPPELRADNFTKREEARRQSSDNGREPG